MRFNRSCGSEPGSRQLCDRRARSPASTESPEPNLRREHRGRSRPLSRKCFARRADMVVGLKDVSRVAGASALACALLGVAAATIGSQTAHAQDAPTYVERYRPQYHFTPATNWTNDPNGLVFYD